MKLGASKGYGSMSNISKYYFLHDCLNETDRKEYEKELNEMDSQKFQEYKEWEKLFEKLLKKNKKEWIQ